jgi:anti-anti-sigma factor
MGNGTGLERATHRIMDIAITQTDNGYTLVALRGELRREASQMLEEKLHPLIAEKGSAMVIDLTGMPTVDSSGLSQLIGLATHARLSESRGGAVRADRVRRGTLRADPFEHLVRHRRRRSRRGRNAAHDESPIASPAGAGWSIAR